jgi:G3E family GTPase
LRAKGILYLADEPSRRHLFHLVGARWSVTPGDPWREEPPASRLALVGLPGSIDEQALGDFFRPFGRSAHPSHLNLEEVE